MRSCSTCCCCQGLALANLIRQQLQITAETTYKNGCQNVLFVDFQYTSDWVRVRVWNQQVVLVIVWQDLFTVKLQKSRPFDGWHELHQLPDLTLLLLSMFTRVCVCVALMWQAYATSLTFSGDTGATHTFQFGFKLGIPSHIDWVGLGL